MIEISLVIEIHTKCLPLEYKNYYIFYENTNLYSRSRLDSS